METTSNYFSYENSSFGAAPLVITVRSLHPQNDSSEILVQLVLENGEHREQKSMPLTMEQYCRLKPQKGQITEEEYEQLEEASQLCLAIRCGENLLAYGSNSVKALSRKIMKHGFSRETACNAALKLEECGLIDEKRDLCRETERCLKKLWGAKRITAHLWEKEFSKETLQHLPDILREVDFVSNCVLLLQKNYAFLPKDADEQRRLIAKILRYGYTFGEVREAMRLFGKESNSNAK